MTETDHIDMLMMPVGHRSGPGVEAHDACWLSAFKPRDLGKLQVRVPGSLVKSH